MTSKSPASRKLSQELDAPQKKLNSGPNFLDNLDLINELIEKQRSRWTLTALVWMDWDDISQILRTHLFVKWPMYDQNKPLGPWVSVVVGNQIRNLVESKYTNYTKPCCRCEAATGDSGCSIYGEQGRLCPLYARWMRIKGNALATKLPVSLEDHSQEVHELPDNNEDLTDKIARFHDVIIPLLTAGEQKIYQWCYIDGLEDDEVKVLMAKAISDKVIESWPEKLKVIKFKIVEKAKQILKEEDI